VPLTRRGWIVAAAVALGISIPLAAASVAPADDTVITVTPSPDVPLAVQQPTQDVPPPPPPPPPRSAVRQPTKDIPPPPPPSPGSSMRNTVTQGTGVIAGRVVDPSGAALPGVQLTLTEAGSSAAFSTTTNAVGRFEFKDMRPGQYDLVARLAGFSTVSNRVRLAAAQNIDGNLTLPLGTLQETITVACGTSVLESFLETLMPTLHAQDMPPPPPPAPPVRVGGNIKAPTKVKDVRPSCPVAPAVDTLVRLTARIGADGVPFDVMAEPASANTAPPREFVDAAIAAVNQWAFTPTLLNGRPTEVAMKVNVTFKRQ
jgi:carboxypeptidase family protein/TonB-like protein